MLTTCHKCSKLITAIKYHFYVLGLGGRFGIPIKLSEMYNYIFIKFLVQVGMAVCVTEAKTHKISLKNRSKAFVIFFIIFFKLTKTTEDRSNNL